MKKTLILSLFLLIGYGLSAQQDALFSQYMFNKLVVNAAYAGSRDVLSATAVNRYQWVGLDGGPKTLTFSLHSPLRNEKIAVGMYLYSDKIGMIHDYGFMLNYAYRLILGEGKLSFGIQAGLKHLKIEWDKSTVFDQDDYYWYDQPITKPRVDANFGLYYYNESWYVGLSSKNLFENSIIQSKDQDVIYTTLARHFYLMGGYAFKISDDFIFRPSALIKYTLHAPPNMDFNASAFFFNTLWLGLSYRTWNNAAVFLTQIVITDNLYIGYSYDTYLNSEVQAHFKGSHEIMVGYDINLFKSRQLTPRYF